MHLGIPPAPRGIPQIEVTFQVDANGILQVAAEDKGTGKAKNITITPDQGRLSTEDIERMKADAERFAEEDKMIREQADARNGLESYLYNLKNSLEGDATGSISAGDRKELLDLINESTDWLSDNMDSSKDDLDQKRKEVEQVANPILREMYSGSGGGGGGYDNGDEDFDMDDEL